MPTESPVGAITIGDGVRFDDQGVTIRNLFRTHRIGWAEVHHFADGCTAGDGHSNSKWVLAVVLNNGRTVMAWRTAAPDVAPSKTLVAVGQAAARYGIPADLAGTIERGTFPAALLGISGAIRVTIRDERPARGGRAPVLEVIERTEPLQPGDILALSHDGTEVEVLGTRQMFAMGRWEQLAHVGDILGYRPSPSWAWIHRIRPRLWRLLIPGRRHCRGALARAPTPRLTRLRRACAAPR